MYIRHSRRWMPLLFISVAVVVFRFDDALAASRVALLIGNSNYSETSQLKNPVNDIQLMRSSLESAGFDMIETVVDLDRSAMVKALRNFEDKAEGADVAVVYYSGHGMEMNGQNYLLPVDARLQTDKDVEDEAVPLDRVQRSIEGAKRLKLIILDACRNNPFVQSMTRSVGTRAVTKGLARVEPESADMLIAFASKAGTVALDGDGVNSPFAEALSKYLVQPGVDVRIALGKVRDEVVQATDRNQEPFVYGSLGGAQIFLNIKEVNINVTNNGTTGTEQQQQVSPNGQSEAAADWQNIRDLADKDLLDAFIAKHGSDPVYKMLAEKKLKLLAEAEQTKGQDASEIAWEALKGSTDAAALTRFIERYPESSHKVEAEQQIASLEPQKGLSVNVEQQQSQAVRDCYLLAGEPQSLPDFNGVAFLKIDSTRSLTACAQAVNENPQDGMLVNLLGRSYDAGRNYTEARRNYQKAVDLGNMYALTNLGWFSVYGTDGTLDVEAGRQMFEKASIAGNHYAQASLGWLYREGYGGVTQDYAEALKWYGQAANQGNANALASMGWFYREGVGVTQDYVKSLDYYRQAADRGDANAISSVGYAYQNGLGTAQNYAEAKTWYEKGTKADDSYSMASLAWLYDTGNGVKQDYIEARYWYEKAANSGSTYAMGNLSRLYDWGLGTKADPKEAVRWAVAAVESKDADKLTELKQKPENFTEEFRKELQGLLKERGLFSGSLDGIFGSSTAAALDALAAGRTEVASTGSSTVSTSSSLLSSGTTSSSESVKQCYELAGEPNSQPGFNGVLFAKIDTGKAIPACKQAISDDPSDSMLVNMLGRAYDSAQNYPEARRAYQQAIDAGNLYALTNLAWFSIYGTDGAQDTDAGMSMFRKAAEAGNAYAQASIAWVYREGYAGVTKDVNEAAKWYTLSGEQGYANAMASLGWMHREGVGLPQDYAKSLEWYRKAADAGDVNAMSSMGYAVQNGLGTAIDFNEARRWYELAAKENDYYSIASLAWLYESGNGVKQDFNEARRLYEDAANGGNAYAMGNLSRLYDQGLGTRADAKQAARWAVASVEGGEPSKRDEMKTYPGNFSAQFRKEVQRLLKEKGYYSGPVDGDFGVATQNAIDKLSGQKS